MIKIYDKTGDFGLEISDYSCTYEGMVKVVEGINRMGGYVTADRKDRLVFVPLHQIEFIRVEENFAE